MPIPQTDHCRIRQPNACSQALRLAGILFVSALIALHAVSPLWAQSVTASNASTPDAAISPLTGQEIPGENRSLNDIECEIRLQLILDQPLWIEGEIRSQQASLSNVRNLSMEAGTTGAFIIRELDQFSSDSNQLRSEQTPNPQLAGNPQPADFGQQLAIHPRQPVDRLGVEFHYRGPRTEVLNLRLSFTSKATPKSLKLRSKATTATSAEPQNNEPNESNSSTPNSSNASVVVNVAIPIDDLLSGVIDQKLASGVRMWVGRPGSDALRVTIGAGQSMVLSAGEQMPLSVDVLAAPGLMAKNPSEPTSPSLRSMELKMELTNDRTGAVAWQRSVPVDPANHQNIYTGIRTNLHRDQLILPTEEGVYTLRTRIVPSGTWRMVERLTRPDLLTRPNLLVRPDMLLAEESLVERATQFVVLESLPRPADPTDLKEIAHWTPNQRSWFGFEANSLNSTQPVELIDHAGMTVAKLAPESQISQPIKIAGKGLPHILVVRYFRDQPVKMTVAVRQKDRAGKWSAIGIDSAVVDDWSLDHFPTTAAAIDTSTYVPTRVDQSTTGPAIAQPTTSASAANQTQAGLSKLAEHRIIFWPSDDQPLLILRNENNRADLKIESISVLAGPNRLAGPDRLAGNTTTNGHSATADSSKRLAAVYLDKPLLADSFGCERQLDSSGQVALDDWTTFLQAGTRLVDYVQATGANAAVISAISEGGSLFPTQIVSATPRYDTGAFFGDGRDPVQKDVLELLYRLFERSGIKLILSVELATPMPQLEAILDATDQPTGLTWVDHLGRELLDHQPARRGIGAYYNILDPRVENQLQLLLDEVVQRYSHHQSFAGIGLQLGSNSLLQLPGPNFGRDANSLNRFRADMETELRRPTSDGNAATNPIASKSATLELPASTPALNAWLDAEGKDYWVRWRARQLSAVFRRAASRLQGAPLVLITADYRPANSDFPGGDALQFGLDWQELASTPNVTPLRLIRRRQLVEPARRIEDARLNEDLVLNEMLRHGLHSRFNSPYTSAAHNNVRQQLTSNEINISSGGLLFTPPEPLEISIKSSSNSRTPLTLFPQAISAPPQHLRDISQLLETIDSQIIFVGGWTPSIAPQAETQNWLKAFAALPRKRFQDVEPADARSAVVRVRQCITENSLWIYAVNSANWPMAVRLDTDAPAGTLVRQFGSEENVWQIGMNSPQNLSEPLTGGSAESIVDGLSHCWSGVLQPGDLVVLEVAGPARGVGRWTAKPLVDPMPEIAARLDDLTARVSILGQPREHLGLVNGSFENVLPREKEGPQSVQLEGWMRSQHPANCVEVTRDAVHGQVALQLRTDETPGARTWLLSTPLESPETGRLAVSLRAKALVGNPVLRIAVEGRVRGAALRYSVNVQPKTMVAAKSDGSNQATAKKPTNWPDQTYWLYVTDLPDNAIEDLRIAIDLVTPGQIAIDEVRFFDFFFTQQERDVLQRQTFVAVERLSKGDPTSAVRLLDSHWARYLRWLEMAQLVSSQQSAITSLNTQATSVEPLVITGGSGNSGQKWRNDNAPAVPSSTTATPAPPNSSPQTFADRIRQYLPAPLRF